MTRDVDFDYDQLSPGIRDFVRELRTAGWNTTDSGDGCNYGAGMKCALPFRHVFIRVEVDDMVESAMRLAQEYPAARVEVSWSPGEPAIIMVMPDGL